MEYSFLDFGTQIEYGDGCIENDGCLEYRFVLSKTVPNVCARSRAD